MPGLQTMSFMSPSRSRNHEMALSAMCPWDSAHCGRSASCAPAFPDSSGTSEWPSMSCPSGTFARASSSMVGSRYQQPLVRGGTP